MIEDRNVNFQAWRVNVTTPAGHFSGDCGLRLAAQMCVLSSTILRSFHRLDAKLDFASGAGSWQQAEWHLHLA